MAPGGTRINRIVVFIKGLFKLGKGPIFVWYNSKIKKILEETFMTEIRTEILKVSAKSSPNKVAGALAGVIRKNYQVELHAIGAGAVNQTIKAIAIARGFMAPAGIDLICIPAFIDVSVEDRETTAIRLLVENRTR
jgi:stage V sporulation protein S